MPTASTISGRQLEAFRCVVVAGSVSKAAQRMHLSQPAVSRLISELERRIGFQLFDRGRRFQLRDEGKLLYREVERAFIGVEKIAQRAEDIRNFRTGHLRIAASPALALGLLPAVMREFRAAFDAVTISVQVLASPAVAEWVASGPVDVGLAALPITQEGVVIRPFPAVPAVCMVPPNHPLARKPFLTPKELTRENVISLGPDSLLRTSIDRSFDSTGVPHSSSVETSMSAHAALLVAEGLGITIIDPFTALSRRSEDLRLKPFMPRAGYDFALLLPAHVPQARVTEAFISMVDQRVRAVAAEVEGLYKVAGSRRASRPIGRQ